MCNLSVSDVTGIVVCDNCDRFIPKLRMVDPVKVVMLN